MKNEDRTKEQMTAELEELRRRVAQYEKKEEEQARHMEELSLTLDCIGEGVIIVDRDGKITLFNSAAGDITGWSPGDAAGRPLEEVFCLVKKESGERCISPVQSVIKTGEKAGLDTDTLLVTGEGARRFVSATFAPLRDKRGDTACVVVVFRDLTEVKRAQDAVIDSEKKYRTLVENCYDLVYEVDSAGNILYVNPACKELTGYEQSELVGENAFGFIHPDDLLNAMSVFQRAILNFSTERATFRARDKSGQYNWLECTGNPFYTATGEVRGVIITRDITERKLAEQELTLLNTLMNAVHRFLDLKEVYKVALDMIMTLENVDMAMIYLVDKERNEAVLQAERNLPEFYVERAGRIPHPKGITWKVIDSGAILNIEDAQKSPHIGAAGRELGHHSILGIPVLSGDDVIGVIWFLSYKERKFSEREVSLLSSLGDQIALAVAKAKMLEEIKSAQEQLIQSEKLASLGQLISSIAHEINNPLTPIVGYSQALLSQPDIDDKSRRSLEVIHSSAERVVKIIEKLLSFSRTYKPLRVYEDINYLIEQSLEFREYQLQLDNVEIVRDLDPELPKTMVDPNQIQQVFTNVILNAEQAIGESKGGGRITVRTRVRKGNTIEISLSDTGPGIPHGLVGKLFDPFFTTKEPGKGTGLGLSVSYGIIKEHGGDIQAFSEEGEGTTFVIELPVLEWETGAGKDKQSAIPRSPNTIKGKRILVVEDEEIVVDLIRGILEGADGHVDIARNGQEALEIMDSNAYDLVICDIKMPEINGFDLYNEIKTANPDLARRVVFMTGDPGEETIAFLNETGNEFITKPFKVGSFRARINDVFTGHPE